MFCMPLDLYFEDLYVQSNICICLTCDSTGKGTSGKWWKYGYQSTEVRTSVLWFSYFQFRSLVSTLQHFLLVQGKESANSHQYNAQLRWVLSEGLTQCSNFLCIQLGNAGYWTEGVGWLSSCCCRWYTTWRVWISTMSSLEVLIKTYTYIYNICAYTYLHLIVHGCSLEG